MKKNSWVKLWRSQFDNELLDTKPYNEGYAFSWLYARANHKPGVVNFRNEYIDVRRGELITSKIKMAEKFGWTYRRVENFLKALKVEDMITYETSNRYIKIFILNYDKHQGGEEENEKQNNEQTDSQTQNRSRTEAEQQHTNKNVNNNNNDKNNTHESEMVSFESVDLELAATLRDEIKKNLPTFKEPNLDSWAREINKMRRLDKRTHEQIAYVITWCQKDPFWQSNILSGSKLRKQFDTLVAQIKRNATKTKSKGLSIGSITQS